jgi:hypothetical protein
MKKVLTGVALGSLVAAGATVAVTRNRRRGGLGGSRRKGLGTRVSTLVRRGPRAAKR